MASVKKIFVFITLACVLLSCAPRLEKASVLHELPPFHGLELNGVFEVNLIQDASFSLRIAADEDVLKNVVFSVENDVLKISNSSTFKWMNPQSNKIELFVNADRLGWIRPNESCHIRSLNPIIAEDFQIVMGHPPKLAEIDLELDTKSFYYWNNHQCGGKVTLRGRTSSLMAFTFGYMSIDAGSLVAGYALIENNSKGDCEVFVSDKIECSIRGLGNIYVHGRPPEIVVHETSSEGQLIEVD